jgi:hypothetical protein
MKLKRFSLFVVTESPSLEPETFSSMPTDSEAGPQAELRSLRDAICGAINAIEENAPHAPIERELVILDRVADELGNMMCEDESGRER